VRREPEERPDREFPAPGPSQDAVQTASFGESLGELVFEQFIPRVNRDDFRPRFPADAARHVSECGQVERKRLPTAGACTDDRATGGAPVEVFEDALRGEDLEPGQLKAVPLSSSVTMACRTMPL
jgi:hypothetical protein